MIKPDNIFANRYHLIKRIGQGGFSDVWKAYDHMAEDAVVAIKIYSPERGMDERGIKQFRREYASVLNLNHPNLLTARYFDICEGRPFLIMPYISGGSLGAYLQDNGTMKESELAVLICQMAETLLYLHSEGILHQDIKPDNILINEKGNYLLTDFGISSQLRSTLRNSTTSNTSMTVAYAPPERFDAISKSLPAGDIFSLGVLIYELASGDVPWMGNGGVSLKIGAEMPHLPEQFSPGLNDIVRRMLDIEPTKRPDANTVYLCVKSYIESGKWDLLSNIKNVKDTYSNHKRGRNTQIIDVDKHRDKEYIDQKVNKDYPLNSSSNYDQAKIQYKKEALKIIQTIGREQWFRNQNTELDKLSFKLGLDEATRIELDEEVLQLYSTKLERDLLVAKYKYKYDDDVTIKMYNAIEIADILSEIGVLKRPFLIYPKAENNDSVPFWSISEIVDQPNLKLSCSIDGSRISVNDARFCSECLLPVNESNYFEKAAICIDCHDKRTTTTSINVATNKIGVLNNSIWTSIHTTAFRMGSQNAKQCDVYLTRSLKVLRTPVTVPMYTQIGQDLQLIKNQLPITKVNWLEAIEFCNKLSRAIGFRKVCYSIDKSSKIPQVKWDNQIRAVRLPTEAEWEFLCRSGTNKENYVPDNDNFWDYIWYDEDELAKVTEHKPNSFGLYGMLGNIWEWVWDDDCQYPKILENPYRNESKALNKIVRGGSFIEKEEEINSYVKQVYPWNFKNINIGFRVVIDEEI
jgi:serine/threonine protein kinase